MQIEIQIDEKCKEPKVIVVTGQMTEEVSEIVKKLSEEPWKTIAGFRDGTAEVLEPDSLLRIYACNGRVYAQTNHGEYQLRLRLYELEQRLDRHSFVRISHSEIIHMSVSLSIRRNARRNPKGRAAVRPFFRRPLAAYPGAPFIPGNRPRPPARPADRRIPLPALPPA